MNYIITSTYDKDITVTISIINGVLTYKALPLSPNNVDLFALPYLFHRFYQRSQYRRSSASCGRIPRTPSRVHARGSLHPTDSRLKEDKGL